MSVIPVIETPKRTADQTTNTNQKSLLQCVATVIAASAKETMIVGSVAPKARKTSIEGRPDALGSSGDSARQIVAPNAASAQFVRKISEMARRGEWLCQPT